MRIFNLEELEAMPTLAVGQTCNLKHDNGIVRVWLSRCTVEDGEPYDNKVTVEALGFPGEGWETVATYEAKPAGVN
jgi:hypothetical protein